MILVIERLEEQSIRITLCGEDEADERCIAALAVLKGIYFDGESFVAHRLTGASPRQVDFISSAVQCSIAA